MLQAILTLYLRKLKQLKRGGTAWGKAPHKPINAHIKSVNRLAEVLDYGCFADDLFLLIADPLSRNVIKTTLLDTYFPLTRQVFLQNKAKGEGYIHDMENYLLNEPEAKYKHISIQTEEDVFVRSGLFKKLVPQVYRATCSFTGMRLNSTYGHSFIDACHIVPFAISHDDKVNNGIALCPNMHRAFDRGLLSIDTNYQILVSPHIAEDEKHPYGLKQLQRKQIALPGNSLYYPAQDKLEWHRGNVFKV